MIAVALRAQQFYQGNDWQTHRYAVAQVFDTLDQVRETTLMLLSCQTADGMTPTRFAATPLLADLCNDLAGEIELALADLAVTLQQHIPSRWLMVELRTLVRQLPALAYRAEHESDLDLIPQLGDLAERVRFVLQRIDQ